MRKWLAFLAVYFCLCLLAGGVGRGGTVSGSSESSTTYAQSNQQAGPAAEQIPRILESEMED